MKQTVEEAAYDYATNKTKFRKDVLKEVDADTYVSRHADSMEDFQCGAEWQSKQSPWISVKERLPEENKEYLVVLDNRVIYVAQYNKNNKSWLIYGTGYTYNVVAYMPIPSFDEILEANRDVLERIKEKGD
jgi:hypothetical protein